MITQVHFRRRLGIIRARQAAGLTQRQLSERIGLRRDFIGMVELGRKNPSLESASRWAKELGVPIERFNPDEDEAEPRAA